MSKRILIVYYSRTGVTEKVALQLKERIKDDCTVEKIIDKQNREGISGFIKAGHDALKGKMTKIEEIKNDVSQYDLVIIGTPIWAGNISSAVRTYINLNKNKFNKVAFFTTQASKREYKAFDTMKELCERKPKGLLRLTNSDIKNNDEYEEKIKKFIISIT